MAETPGKMYALAVVLTLLPLIAIPLRVYTRRIQKCKLQWDDFLVLPALVGLASHVHICLRRTKSYIAGLRNCNWRLHVCW